MDIFIRRTDKNSIKFLKKFGIIKDKLYKSGIDVVVVDIDRLDSRRIQPLIPHARKGLPFANVNNPNTGKTVVIHNPVQMMEILLNIYYGKKKIRADAARLNGGSKYKQDDRFDPDRGLTKADVGVTIGEEMMTDGNGGDLTMDHFEKTRPVNSRPAILNPESDIDILASEKFAEQDHEYVDVGDFTQAMINEGEIGQFAVGLGKGSGVQRW